MPVGEEYGEEISTGAAPVPGAPPTSPAAGGGGGPDYLRGFQYLLGGVTDTARALSAQRHGYAPPSGSIVGDLAKAEAVERASAREAAVAAEKLQYQRNKDRAAMATADANAMLAALPKNLKEIADLKLAGDGEAAAQLATNLRNHYRQRGWVVGDEVWASALKYPDLVGPEADALAFVGIDGLGRAEKALRIAKGKPEEYKKVVAEFTLPISQEAMRLAQGYVKAQREAGKTGDLDFEDFRRSALAFTEASKRPGLERFLGGQYDKTLTDSFMAFLPRVGIQSPDLAGEVAKKEALTEAGTLPDIDEAALLREFGITKSEFKKRTPKERALIAQVVKTETIKTAGEAAEEVAAGQVVGQNRPDATVAKGVSEARIEDLVRPAKMETKRQEKVIALEFEKQKKELDNKYKTVTRADIDRLRDDFTKASADFVTVKDAYAGIRQIGQESSPLGDVALVFGYMKLLDPRSTVREGEQAQVANAAAVPDRVRNLYNRLVTGDRLTPEQRTDLLKQAGTLYDTQLASHKERETVFRGIAKRAGIDEADVVLDLAGRLRGGSSVPETAKPGAATPTHRYNPQTKTLEKVK